MLQSPSLGFSCKPRTGETVTQSPFSRSGLKSNTPTPPPNVPVFVVGQDPSPKHSRALLRRSIMIYLLSIFLLACVTANHPHSDDLRLSGVESQFPQCPNPCGDNPRIFCPYSKAVPARDKDVLFRLDGGLAAEDGWYISYHYLSFLN